MPDVGPTPRNDLLGQIADALMQAKSPSTEVGPTQTSNIMEFLLGQAPEGLDRMSYGEMPTLDEGLSMATVIPFPGGKAAKPMSEAAKKLASSLGKTAEVHSLSEARAVESWMQDAQARELRQKAKGVDWAPREGEPGYKGPGDGSGRPDPNAHLKNPMLKALADIWAAAGPPKKGIIDTIAETAKNQQEAMRMLEQHYNLRWGDLGADDRARFMKIPR